MVKSSMPFLPVLLPVLGTGRNCSAPSSLRFCPGHAKHVQHAGALCLRLEARGRREGHLNRSHTSYCCTASCCAWVWVLKWQLWPGS